MKRGVLICGVGRIGEAFAHIIAPREHIEIALWDTDSTKITHQFSPQDLARQAHFIFLCTPSSAVRALLEQLRDNLIPGAVVVSVIKGLDAVSSSTMYEVMQEVLPPHASSVILGGPMLSGELTQGKKAYGIAGCDAVTYQKISPLFAPTLLKLEHSTDAQGICIAGVLKNVYAMGLGITHALRLGDNAQGWLITQALTEMRQLLAHLGAQPETINGLAGVGDLVATSFSQHSRNRTVGEDLVRTGQTAIPSEGLISLPLLITRLGDDFTHTPFLKVMKEIVVDHEDASLKFASLLPN